MSKKSKGSSTPAADRACRSEWYGYSEDGTLLVVPASVMTPLLVSIGEYHEAAVVAHAKFFFPNEVSYPILQGARLVCAGYTASASVHAMRQGWFDLSKELQKRGL